MKLCQITVNDPIIIALCQIDFSKTLSKSVSAQTLKVGGNGRVVRWCWVNFQCRGVLLIWIRVGQGPTALAVGAGGGCLDIFYSRLSFLFLFLPFFGRRHDID